MQALPPEPPGAALGTIERSWDHVLKSSLEPLPEEAESSLGQRCLVLQPEEGKEHSQLRKLLDRTGVIGSNLCKEKSESFSCFSEGVGEANPSQEGEMKYSLLISREESHPERPWGPGVARLTGRAGV